MPVQDPLWWRAVTLHPVSCAGSLRVIAVFVLQSSVFILLVVRLLVGAKPIPANVEPSQSETYPSQCHT
jgi:hypothetical protein